MTTVWNCHILNLNPNPDRSGWGLCELYRHDGATRGWPCDLESFDLVDLIRLECPTPQWVPLHTILDDNAYRVKVPRWPGTAADLGKMPIESCQITAPITTGLDLQTLGPARDSRVSTQIRS